MVNHLKETMQAILSDIAVRRAIIHNGVEWETEMQRAFRRIRALEAHIIDIELRYSLLESRLNEHSQGTRHRSPKPKLPKPDEE